MKIVNWKLQTKILLGTVLIFACILLLNNFAIHRTVRESISKTIDRELDLLTSNAASMITIGVDSAVKNYLRGIAEKNKEIVEHYYAQFQSGVLSEEEAKQQAAAILLSQKIGQTGYLYVLDIHHAPAEIRVAVHSRMPVGEDVSQYEFARQIAEIKNGYIEYAWKNPEEEEEREKALVSSFFEPWNWLICASSYKEEFRDLVHPDDFAKELLGITIGETGYLALMDMQGLLLVHPKMQGENIYNAQDARGNYFIQEVIRKKNGTIFYQWQNNSEGSSKMKFAHIKYIPEMQWIIWATSYTEEMYRPLDQLTTFLEWIAAGTLGFLILLSLGLSHTITRPIVMLSKFTEDVAQGDLSKQIQMTRRDEIGDLANKLNQMVRQLRTISGQVHDTAYSMNTTSDTISQEMNTLTKRMTQQATSVDCTTAAAENINQFITTLGTDTDELLSATEQILSSTHEIQATREEVTTSIGHVTNHLQKISTFVEQVDSSVFQVSEHTRQLMEVAKKTGTEVHHIDHSFQEVSHNAERSRQLAEETRKAALDGQTSVEASIKGMTELKDVVSNIARTIREVNSWGEQVSSILDIVDDITGQTSLLALNASIISAQAGAQGKGFAVVADEIKELATRTKSSTQEISSLIHALQHTSESGVSNVEEGINKAEQGVQLVSAVKDSLNTILESATRSSSMASDTARVSQQTTSSSQAIRTSMNTVTEMVSQIGQAIQEQKHDIAQVVTAVENIREMSEHVTHSSIEQNDTSRQIVEKMEYITEKLSTISEQTGELNTNSHQIVTSMHTLETITEHILQETNQISSDTVKDMVNQSDTLQQAVNAFKLT